MLHGSNLSSAESSAPPSPRRLPAHQIEPQPSTPRRSSRFTNGHTASPQHPQGISSASLSPGYFKQFFTVDRELGRGGKGVVLLVSHVLDGVPLGQFACKRIPVGDDHQWLEKVLYEVQLLQNLSHQNLVSYRHVWLEDAKINTFGPSVPCAFVLQQYCNSGDLLHYICDPGTPTSTAEELKNRIRRRSKGQPEAPLNLHRPRRLHFEEIYSFFKDITSGLNYLHGKGYIHRDLKPSNCLLHDTGTDMRVLVSDFGEVQEENMLRRSTGTTGTISYCAPEVLNRSGPNGAFGNFTTKSDVFSLGMILYFMCFGRLPYHNSDSITEEDEDIDQLRDEIRAWSGFDNETRVRFDLPEKLYRFLKRLLSLDPAKRPSAEDILHGISTGGGMEDSVPGSGATTGSILEEIRSDSPRPPGFSSPRYTSNSTGLARANPPRLRPLSFSQDPNDTTQPTSSRRPSPKDSSVILRPRPTHRNSATSPNPSPNSPMLLPAPSPPYQSRSGIKSPSLLLTARIALFLLKLITVSQPCTPLAPNPLIAYPLLCLAGLELALAPFGIFHTANLLLLHLAVVFGALRWNRLCAPPRSLAWEDL
jgi:serine/threonine protein kinase